MTGKQLCEIRVFVPERIQKITPPHNMYMLYESKTCAKGILQRTVRRTVQNFSFFRKPRAVARAVPAVLGFVVTQRTAQMRAAVRQGTKQVADRRKGVYKNLRFKFSSDR